MCAALFYCQVWLGGLAVGQGALGGGGCIPSRAVKLELIWPPLPPPHHAPTHAHPPTPPPSPQYKKRRAYIRQRVEEARSPDANVPIPAPMPELPPSFDHDVGDYKYRVLDDPSKPIVRWVVRAGWGAYYVIL